LLPPHFHLESSVGKEFIEGVVFRLRANMRTKWFLCGFLAILLFLFLFLGINLHLEYSSKSNHPDVFVGVDAAYDNVENMKSLVDEVRSYANFFVIGSTGITFNITKLNDVCQYVNDSGLHFTTYMHTTTLVNQSQWISYARQRWGYRFLGLYTYDEPGGHQIDRDDPFMVITQADDYFDAADKYVENLNRILLEFKYHDFPLITSDYALYDFDYKAGYDLVLTEFAWNHSRLLNIALCRGAATMHGKDWGVMITYTYDTPPYLASGPEIYEDMVNAYQNGAKYIVVFDYAKDPATNSTHGILQQEHLDALKQFWQYIKEHHRTNYAADDRVAYVLPKNYGYGFRGPNDSLWGLWEADNLSSRIWSNSTTLVAQYKPKIDIVYEDDLQLSGFRYRKLIFWNGTTITNE
jgi:hypothetical protein